MSNDTEMQHEPYVKALQLITDARARRAYDLYLAEMGLGILPQEIAELWWLRSLALGDYIYTSGITDIAAVGYLKSLEWLELAGTPTSSISPLRGLTRLRYLGLSRTRTFDLTPIRGLTSLCALDLTGSSVRDLTPIRDLPFEPPEADEPNWGLAFANTPATENDPELRRLSEIPDRVQRTRETLAYLKTLPETASTEASAALEIPNGEAENIAVIRHAVLGLADRAVESDARANKTYEELQTLDKKVTARSNRFIQLMRQSDEAVETRLRENLDQVVAALRAERAVGAPIELWKAKQAEHEERRATARKLFLLGLAMIAVSVLGLLCILLRWGPEIESMLAPLGCTPATPTACTGVSLRAILAMAATMALFTVLLWFTRLQMKLFLAERHLVLDSRERQAFAETYVSLLRSPGTTDHALESRSVVYASLFRPSSDGFVKEDAGVEAGLIAALSRLLSQR